MNLLFGLHFGVADDGEASSPFVAFKIEVACNRNHVPFGGVFLRKFARLCKFEGEPLRTTGESVLNDATVKTPF